MSLREKEDSNRDQQSRAKPEPASHLFGKYQNTRCQEGRLEKQRDFQMPIAQEPYRGEKRRINGTAMAPTDLPEVDECPGAFLETLGVAHRQDTRNR